MANFAMVLGVRKGEPSLIGSPSDLSTAKKKFTSIVMDGGVSGSSLFDEVWLCDTVQGRLRRKAFCHAPATLPPAKKAKG